MDAKIIVPEVTDTLDTHVCLHTHESIDCVIECKHLPQAHTLLCYSGYPTQSLDLVNPFSRAFRSAADC